MVSCDFRNANFYICTKLLENALFRAISNIDVYRFGSLLFPGLRSVAVRSTFCFKLSRTEGFFSCSFAYSRRACVRKRSTSPGWDLFTWKGLCYPFSKIIFEYRYSQNELDNGNLTAIQLVNYLRISYLQKNFHTRYSGKTDSLHHLLTC